jgi:glycosyltransferase involved in cell wall biosynthesis
VAEFTNATITLLHATGQTPRDAEERLFTNFAPALHGLGRLTRSVITVGDVSQAIIEEADSHQVVVMGAPARQVAPDGWGGPILEAVTSSIDTTLIVVKQCLPVSTLQAEAETEKEIPSGIDRPIAVVVDKWFAENTFHSSESANLERLVALKEDQNLTISLGLPALNEEETVGNVIQTIKTALLEQVPLLDEIVLIDSGSVDCTREIAANLGIPVYIHQEILPQYVAYHGKGEALWKSLYVLNGDIVAWIDTDIKNIHPRFVHGILGPLLRDQRIQYVKGFYQRPLRRGDRLVASGGGRVTELTARPLINLFFPELSGLIQPLAGEYAGRRQVLERLPFFTGYGVETGLLIDILETLGLQAIAQVDLLKRIHHNKSLRSLSQMSFAIIQVIIRRLEDRYKIRLLEEVNKTMNLVRYEPKRFYLETTEIRERERPPMITLPEYRQKRGLGPLPTEVELPAAEAIS